MIKYFPVFFFLVFLSYGKLELLPLLLCMGLFLDKIYYNLPFVNTGLILFLFLINFVSKGKTKQILFWKTLGNSIFYFGVLTILARKIDFFFCFIQILLNIVLLFLLPYHNQTIFHKK